MTWSYGSPADGNKDAVRFLVGDTDEGDQLVTDEEIEFALTQAQTLKGAAAFTARAIAALFSRDVDTSTEAGRFSDSQRAEHYRQLSRVLYAESFQDKPLSSSSSPVPVVTGVSVSDMESASENDDRVRPAFRKGMFDIAGTDPDKEGYC